MKKASSNAAENLGGAMSREGRILGIVRLDLQSHQM